jgi:hypothetical protein
MTGRSVSSRAEWACVVALAVATFVGGVLCFNPNITGLYHDDGIYIATAKSIAERGSYRLINLPGEPFATKYPPLYPATLAVVWKIWPEFPANLALLKSVNCALVAALLVVIAAWLKRLPGTSPWERMAALALIATAPGVFSFGDLVLSEPLYTLLTFAVFALLPDDEEPVADRRALLLALLCGAAALTRTIGATLCAALVITLWRRNRRAAVVASVALACVCGPWLVWTRVARGVSSHLLDYYVEYETSAWQLFWYVPGRAWSIVSSNVVLYSGELERVLGTGWSWLTVIAMALAVVGLRRRVRGHMAVCLVLYVTSYVAVVLGHPYPMVRYWTPLVPLVLAAMVLGARACATGRLGPVTAVPVLLVAMVHVGWIPHYRSVTARGVHGEFGRAFPFEWSGFAQTIDWLKANTPPDAVVASGYDPLYYLYTGRHTVRPWWHDVQLYGGDKASAGAPGPPWLLDQLLHLGVSYVLIDPFLLGSEGEHGRRSIAGILRVRPQWIREVHEGAGHRVFFVTAGPLAISLRGGERPD